MYTCDATFSKSDGSNPTLITKSQTIAVRGFSVAPKSQLALSGSVKTLSCTVVGEQQAVMKWYAYYY